MAERRMFAKTIIDSDAFLDMPLSTQALYFHLSMRADDEGFINNPKKIQRVVGATEDDLKLLMAKNFIISFESGVVVIKHWRLHNYLQNDRIKPTVYTDERNKLTLKPNKVYTLENTECIQNGYNSYTQDSIEERSIEEISIERGEGNTPSLEEIKRYIEENNYKVNAERFFDYYESQGWRKSNGQNIRDWKAAVRSWTRINNPAKKFDSQRDDDINYAEIYRRKYGTDNRPENGSG